MTSTYIAPSSVNSASPFRVSWSSVFAGAAITLVTYLALSVLGTAIGAGAIAPMEQGNPLRGFGTGAGAWLFVSTLLAIAVGAWVSGRTAPDRGGLHGLLSWTMSTLFTTWLIASLAGSLVGTAGNIAGKGLSLAADGVAAAAPGVGQKIKQQLDTNGISLDWDGLKSQLNTTLKQSGKQELDPSKLDQKTDAAGADAQQAAVEASNDPTQAADQLKGWFDRIQKSGEPALNAADKEALVNIVAARTGKSTAEAQKIVDNYAQAYQDAVAKVNQLKEQAEQQAREAADAAARQVSKAAWGTFFMLLLGGALSFGIAHYAINSRPQVVVAAA
ncbi:hypothetical protein [Pseudomonas typographi]|uniref:Membrane protein, TIGR04086 family n=1 Tax=Pseudomonas typographi TaxID=2715964 RepID=A0ABR7Z2S8_9PSED|nr:hypothetical protein [Pseudomonas typographi]MBD1553135.1 hypothetical protein [Pseudomonas typographi]MBD1585877.1 hypothetical protein [Pseudomonas typographi]MBD1599757.1 hypothetical protein [Pseudomonas typographi]